MPAPPFQILFASLPVGLLIGKSVDVTRTGGMKAGCATSHNVANTQWYAHDYWVGPAQSGSGSNGAHWGPFASEAIARQQLKGEDTADLDASGTVGISLWLVLP